MFFLLFPQRLPRAVIYPFLIFPYQEGFREKTAMSLNLDYAYLTRLAVTEISL